MNSSSGQAIGQLKAVEAVIAELLKNRWKLNFSETFTTINEKYKQPTHGQETANILPTRSQHTTNTQPTHIQHTPNTQPTHNQHTSKDRKTFLDLHSLHLMVEIKAFILLRYSS